jgi:hypothetical protein
MAACSKHTPPDGAGGNAAATAAPGQATLGGASLAFLEGFEGEIDATVKKGGPSANATPLAVLVKSGKVRADIPEKLAEGGAARMLGPKAYAIFDPGAKKLAIVSDVRRQVIIIDMNKSADHIKNLGSKNSEPGSSSPQGPPTKVTKTGKTETVAGYSCEDWDISSDHREGTVCVGHEGISWFAIPAAVLPSERAWMLELFDGKHFPLRFVGYDKDGTTEEGRAEITKIDKRSLPAADFEYPADYAVIDLEQMLGAFGGMPGGMPHMAPGMMPSGMPMMPHAKGSLRPLQ